MAEGEVQVVLPYGYLASDFYLFDFSVSKRLALLYKRRLILFIPPHDDGRLHDLSCILFLIANVICYSFKMSSNPSRKRPPESNAMPFQLSTFLPLLQGFKLFSSES